MNPLLLDKQVEPDPIPVTMSLSPEGQLAVGFKRGGLLVLRAYRHYPIGALDKLTLKQFCHILQFVTYSDVEQLRNTCRCFHDRTRALRLQWELLPLRGPLHRSFASYSFMKWCRLEGGEGLSDVGPLRDIHGKEICL
eukprot:gene7479-9576_t